jgi:PHD/YefM family antitoxin component YafN of YafNO toxin-antitoxin module
MELTVFSHGGAVINLKDIQSLTEFQRKSRETIARLKRTGRPAILTVNGQAEIVIQDAEAYQRLLDRAEQAEKLMELRRSIAEYRAGEVRDANKVLTELEARHLGKPKVRRHRPSR